MIEMAMPMPKRPQLLKDLQLFCEYLGNGGSSIELTMDDLTNPQVRLLPLYTHMYNGTCCSLSLFLSPSLMRMHAQTVLSTLLIRLFVIVCILVYVFCCLF